MHLYSTDYLNQATDNALVYIPEEEWVRHIDNLQCNRIFALLRFHDSSVHYSPVSTLMRGDTDTSDHIYVPIWMIPVDQEIGSEIEVEFLPEEAFPDALRIVLRPLDSAFYNTNAEEELTRALTHIGVLKRGSTVSLNLSELGGYTMEFYIVELEPAEIVLCNGDEVVIEFEEAIDQWDGRRPDTPPPPPPELLMPMLPVEEAVVTQPVGNILGGGGVRRMPDGRAWNPWRDIERNVRPPSQR
jgi:hypothetical protein